MKYEGGLNQGRNSGMEINVLYKFCMLNSRLMGLADRADMTCERKESRVMPVSLAGVIIG